MPASYPTSAKTFTTKSNNTTADASHINDVQLEITAIEQDLIAGLPPARGGTGLTSYAIGDLLYASASGTLAKLADVAVGNILMSGGVGVAPSWGQGIVAAWTPADGSGAGLALTVEGLSIKLGRLVIAAASVQYPATVDGSNARINGFPYAASGTLALFGSSPNYTDDGTAWTINLQPGGTHGFLYRIDGTQMTNANLSGNTIRFTVAYISTT
jgi:hypothetical protein